MKYTTLTFASFVGASLANTISYGITSSPKPTPATSTCTETICADYVNSCGIWYGGCYAACKGLSTPTFSPPPCPTTTPLTVTPACTKTKCITSTNSCGKPYGGCFTSCKGDSDPTFSPPPCPPPTITPKPTTTKKSTTTSCTLTKCVDYVNSCGVPYGGCFPACSGISEPTFSPPPCPKTTTTKKSTSTACDQIICVDKVNSCGIKYGGCYPICPGIPTPTFTVPPCPKTTTTKKPTTTACDQIICVDKINSCGIKYGGCYPICPGIPTPTFTIPPCPKTTSKTSTKTTSSCALTKCVDYINSCGSTYGGCFPACTGIPEPTFSPPPCPVTTTSTKKSTGTNKPTSTCTQYICEDAVNSCGIPYGGCYPICPGVPKPTFTVPPCPTTKKSSTSITKTVIYTKPPTYGNY